jgi:hypothetical protein
METKEYELLDGRTIRAKYDRLGMCKISQENLEAFIKEFNTSYRQAKILEKIKENYALMKLDEHKTGKWIVNEERDTICCPFCNDKQKIGKDEVELIYTAFTVFKFCRYCGAKLEGRKEI